MRWQRCLPTSVWPHLSARDQVLSVWPFPTRLSQGEPCQHQASPPLSCWTDSVVGEQRVTLWCFSCSHHASSHVAATAGVSTLIMYIQVDNLVMETRHVHSCVSDFFIHLFFFVFHFFCSFWLSVEPNKAKGIWSYCVLSLNSVLSFFRLQCWSQSAVRPLLIYFLPMPRHLPSHYC